MQNRAMKKILILTDGKAGHENQSKAFVRALGGEEVLVGVKFKSRLAKTFSYLLDKLGISASSLFTLEKPLSEKFDAVVGTGSGTFYAAKTMAKKLGIPCGVVLYPRGYKISTFDCILAPAFDNPPQAANVITIPVNLVAADEAFYTAGEKAFLERFTPSAKPAVAVIVGGPNKCSTLSAEWMRKELERIFAETPGCEHWITTSRRTPADVEAVVDSFPFDYKLLYSKDHFNPIPAFVKRAKRLYVTAESTGMLSEACTFGSAEVYPLDNLHPGKHKFRRFVENLIACGYANGAKKVNLAEAYSQAKALLT